MKPEVKVELSNGAILAEAPRLVAFAKRMGWMSERARPAERRENADLSAMKTLVHVTIKDGEWEARVDGFTRTGMDAETAVRRVATVFLARRKRVLGLPGVLQNDDHLIAEPVADGTWMVKWDPNRREA
jgi:hypothetical protein